MIYSLVRAAGCQHDSPKLTRACFINVAMIPPLCRYGHILSLCLLISFSWLLISGLLLFGHLKPQIPLESVNFPFYLQSFAFQASDLLWLSIWTHSCFLINYRFTGINFLLKCVHFLNIKKYNKGLQSDITGILWGNEYTLRETKWQKKSQEISHVLSVCVRQPTKSF